MQVKQLLSIHGDTAPITYRPDIDGLRALAILLVVIFHAFPSALQGGFIGVDIFFVISGFLISGIIFGRLQQGKFSFTQFYIHRINRIFPALILVLVSVYTFGWFALLPNEFKELGKHIASGAGFIQNFILWKEDGYFDTASEFKPLMHLWSLAIEEQFYLFYPLLIVGAWRLRLNMVKALCVVAIGSFVWNLRGVAEDPVKAFFLSHTRIWELLAGSVLAYLQVSIVGKNSNRLQQFFLGRTHTNEHSHTLRQVGAAKNLLSILGFLLIFAGALHIDKNQPFPGLLALAPVLGAVLLILAGPDAYINRQFLASRLMIFVGLISYPLYLWHWPTLSFIRIVESSVPSTEIRIAAIFVSVILAYLTYRLIETPIRSRAKTWKKTLALCLLLLIAGSVGFHAFRNDGLGFRLKKHNDLLAQQKWDEADKVSNDCRKATGFNDIGYCLSSTSREPNVALIGDSHANSLFSGFAAEYAKVGKTLINLGGPGCIPFYDTDAFALGQEAKPNACRRWTNQALDFAINSPSIHTIIISNYALRQMRGDALGREKAAPLLLRYHNALDLPKADVFEVAFRDTLKRLASTGKEIIVVIDWPELGFQPHACFDIRPFRFQTKMNTSCSVEQSVITERNKQYRSLLRKLQKDLPQVKWFDPFPYLCDDGQCTAVREGRLIYRDDNHLSKYGSAYIGEAFGRIFVAPN